MPCDLARSNPLAIGQVTCVSVGCTIMIWAVSSALEVLERKDMKLMCHECYISS